MAAERTFPVWPFPPEDPYPAYQAIRNDGNVQWNEDLKAWLVIGYEQALAVLRGPEWSADPTRSPELMSRLGAAGPAEGVLTKMLVFSDPPEHDRLRRAVNRFFTPRRVEELSDRIASIVAAATGSVDGETELMEEIAYPVPLAVICELLDVGVDTAVMLRDQTPTMAAMLDTLAPPEMQTDAAGAALSLMLALVPIAAERRQTPGDDLLSTLLQVLPPDEAIVTALLLLAAGHETTSNLIGNGMLALHLNPEQRTLLEREPYLIPQAIEEFLRWDSPVQVTGRVARTTTALDGRRIDQGQQVIVLIGAANRDPSVFDDPDRLDITRSAQPHLAFGHGAHYCVGASLARAEAKAVFTSLVSGGYEVTDWERSPSSTFRRLRRVMLAA